MGRPGVFVCTYLFFAIAIVCFAFFVLFVLFVLSAVLPAMQPYPLVLYWMCICVSSDELERGMEWGGRASSPRVLLVCLFEEEGVLRAGAASF